MKLDEILTQKLQILEAKQLKRTNLSNFRHDGIFVERNGKKLISFSCNDYLGLSQNKLVIEAGINALNKYGVGSGASRLVTGNCPLYEELEALLAQYYGMEDACVFGSGYLANIGTIPALVGKNDLIIADKLSHACIIDGAKLSGATLLRFAHNNYEHCRLLLENNRNEYQNCLIITESVFSMDGDTSPLEQLSGLATKYNSWFMTDNAHNLTKNHQPATNIYLGTLSKAIGSYGGFVCGSNSLIEYLKTSARSLIFSTGLPPVTLATAIKAIEIIKEQPELCQKPLENARIFTDILDLPTAESAIVPLIIGENAKTLAASQMLAEKGFLVAAIRPPTVPENTARLRFTFSALHSKQQIEKLCANVKSLI